MSISSGLPSTTLSDDAILQLERTLNEKIPPAILLIRATYRQELPTLLKSHPGQWVAYHGERQVGTGPNKTGLVQQCLGEGLKRNEFLVLCIEPEAEQQITVPLDVWA